MDKRITPAEERKFSSENRKYLLRVVSVDHWKTREPTAIFSELGKELWRMKLPHSHGPREAVVTDQGATVLIDEWINIKSEYAVTIIPKDGKGKRSWSFEQICTTLDIHSKTLTHSAKSGVWLGGTPLISDTLVKIPAGGLTLVVDTKSLTIHK